MNTTDLSLRDLQYLVTVDATKHFGKAAQMVFVSQPALSGQIKKIEQVLQVSIFERSQRRVMTTATGRLIIDQAKRVLAEAEEIVTLAQVSLAPLTGCFRLGAIATLGPYFFPHLLGPLKKHFAKLELIIREGLTADLLKQLKDGELDAVMAAPTFQDDSLQTTVLFFEPFQLMVNASDPLAKKNQVTEKDLSGDRLLLLEDGHCLKDQILSFCPAKLRADVSAAYQSASLETLRSMVASNMGYTLMPQLAVSQQSLLNRLVRYRKFESSKVGRQIVLVTRKRKSSNASATALSEFIQHKITLAI